jgi:hypothetical protein
VLDFGAVNLRDNGRRTTADLKFQIVDCRLTDAIEICNPKSLHFRQSDLRGVRKSRRIGTHCAICRRRRSLRRRRNRAVSFRWRRGLCGFGEGRTWRLRPRGPLNRNNHRSPVRGCRRGRCIRRLCCRSRGSRTRSFGSRRNRLLWYSVRGLLRHSPRHLVRGSAHGVSQAGSYAGRKGMRERTFRSRLSCGARCHQKTRCHDCKPKNPSPHKDLHRNFSATVLLGD